MAIASARASTGRTGIAPMTTALLAVVLSRVDLGHVHVDVIRQTGVREPASASLPESRLEPFTPGWMQRFPSEFLPRFSI